MNILSDLVLEDIIKHKSIEKQFLEECYCKSGALSDYALISKNILKTRYDYVFGDNDVKPNTVPVTEKKGLSHELTDILSGSLSKRPILLLGDVGVGKSTFIENLTKVEAEVIFQKTLTFKIDLGSQVILSMNIRSAILNELKRQLKEDFKVDVEGDDFVRHCYFKDLETFKNSVYVKRLYETNNSEAISKEILFLTEKLEDQAEHLRRSLIHLAKGQNKQIVIFVDNCDQRNDPDQELAFLIANEFASNWPALVFLTLRPETFHRAKKEEGALSGYHTKAFTIAPPRIDDVLSKRLVFARKITQGEIKLSILSNNTTFSNLDKLIESFINSLQKNRSLLGFIENITNGNIRQAIEILKIFFGSGHVDTKKILKIIEETGAYQVPLHELVRAVMYGDSAHYNPNRSFIANILDVHSGDSREHFLTPLLLGYLQHSSTHKTDGFAEINDVYSHLQGHGFTADQIDVYVDYCYSKKLLETSIKGSRIEIDNSKIKLRITGQGAYHIQQLLTMFTYIDAVLTDTPIFDDIVRPKIQDTFDIAQRLSRVEIFKQYLDDEWLKAHFVGTYFLWPDKSAGLRTDLDRIKSTKRS